MSKLKWHSHFNFDRVKDRIAAFFAREEGQALPIALAVLCLGTLVVAPFLSHAGASLIGSREFSGMDQQNYAADSGVEHAIWSLVHNNLASAIPQQGDQSL